MAADLSVPGTDERARARAGPRVWSRRAPRWASFALLLVVLAAALAIGAGRGSGPSTNAQRAAALETQIRCPSCQAVSVADSNASSAVAVRHQISQMVAAGDTDSQIEAALVARYGRGILLSPPVSGWSALVWVIPVVAGVTALAALGVVFWRRGNELRHLREEGGR
jgi:cytochrome c-type biogenesis protein CcmH